MTRITSWRAGMQLGICISWNVYWILEVGHGPSKNTVVQNRRPQLGALTMSYPRLINNLGNLFCG